MRIGLLGSQDIRTQLRLAGHSVERITYDRANGVSRERFERGLNPLDLVVLAYTEKYVPVLVAGIAKGLGKKLALLTERNYEIQVFDWAIDWSGTELDEMLGWIRMTEVALINAKIDWLATRLGGDNTKQQVVERHDDE